MPTIRKVELIRKKKFAAIALDLEDKILVVYIVSIASSDLVHPFCQAQIAVLKADTAVELFYLYTLTSYIFSLRT